MPDENRSSQITFFGIILAVVVGLYLSSRYSYLLFHSLVEATSIAISFTFFIVTWNTRRYLTSGGLKILGIGYGCIAMIDLLHTLAYKGMGVFPGDGANLPTQFWIAARALQAILLCVAPLFVRRKADERIILAICLPVVAAAITLICIGIFPDCFIEGKGLTPFKVISEYLISAALLLAILLFAGHRSAFTTRVFALIVSSIICTIGSELAFTSYLSVYGPANMIGHFLKLAGFFLLYRAIIVTGFTEPFVHISQDLKQAEDGVTREREFSRSLLESMADGVVACDANGILSLFNRTAREWHSIDPMQLPQEEWAQHYDLFRADGVTPLPTEEIPLAMALRGVEVKDVGMAIVTKGHLPRFILTNGSMIVDSEGRKLGAVVVMRDITEFRRLEQELRQTNEELEQRVAARTAALEQTAIDLQEAQRIAHVGSWDLDLTSNVLSWSDEIYRIFEIDPEKFGASYEAFLDAIHPDDREMVNAAYTYSLKNKLPYAIDHRLLFADGRVKYVHEQCETFWENDQPVRSLGTVQDITEHTLAEQERRTNLTFYESLDLVNRAIQGNEYPEEMMSDVLDEVLTILDCDRAFLMYPCDPEADTWHVPMERTKPEYPGALNLGIEMPMDPEVAETLRILLAADGPVKFGPGTKYPLPAEVSERFGFKCFMAMAVHPKIGKPWQFGIHQCSFGREWTPEEERLFKEVGRRLADGLSSMLIYRDLRASEGRFSTLINQAADGFFVHDLEGRILDVNQRACDSLGYTREELLTMNVAEVDAEFVSHDHVKNFWSKLTLDHPVTLQGRHQRKDGSTFPVEIRLGLLLLEDRRVILGLARDITERNAAAEALQKLNEELEVRVKERTAEIENKSRQLLDSRQALMNLVTDLNDNAAQLAAANAKLQELDRLKSMFIASMSHELRTPLNSIIGFSSILAEEWLGPVTEEQKKNLLTVHRAGQHLLALVNDVIDVSKIEAGKLEVTVSDFDLAEVVDESTNLFTGEIRDKSLELQVDSLHLQMRTDRRRLTQCLINLLSNAVKYTDWGSVRLAARTVNRKNDDADSWLEITVTDTGMGIRDEDLPLLFNAFVRLPLPADKSIRGTGLGLYLTKKIVCETLRGEIGVESKFGKGSCFTLRIPVQLKNGNGNEQGNE
ncbi:MAG: PAS domain S-box protein [Proteobacteria bacterium]|nr:PAS domain S-box protein [Pseudomonadota bacterium]MBU1715276.1 PAS domain S-box protein [Pseudomonadota bacterium]